MNKYIILIIVLLALLGAGLYVFSSVDTERAAENAPLESAATKSDSVPQASAPEQIAVVAKEFSITAKRFIFEPNTIKVKKGDRIVVHMTSIDTTHGFALPDFGVDLRVPAGETGTVEFVADKAGTFSFHCSVFCGAGHAEMKGEFIVE